MVAVRHIRSVEGVPAMISHWSSPHTAMGLHLVFWLLLQGATMSSVALHVEQGLQTVLAATLHAAAKYSPMPHSRHPIQV